MRDLRLHLPLNLVRIDQPDAGAVQFFQGGLHFVRIKVAGNEGCFVWAASITHTVTEKVTFSIKSI